MLLKVFIIYIFYSRKKMYEISANTRSAAKIKELEEANSNLKKENLELVSECADLKEKLEIVTSQLREIQLKQGNLI